MSSAAAATIAFRVRRRWRNLPVSSSVATTRLSLALDISTEVSIHTCCHCTSVQQMHMGGTMDRNMTPEERTAGEPEQPVGGPVTLINSFTVPADRDDAFHALWTETSMYFRQRPGFVS